MTGEGRQFIYNKDVLRCKKIKYTNVTHLKLLYNVYSDLHINDRPQLRHNLKLRLRNRNT
jgi:hypothetical protein